MKNFIFIIFASLLISACGQKSSTSNEAAALQPTTVLQCAIDTECKGDRVCEGGKCIAPNSGVPIIVQEQPSAISSAHAQRNPKISDESTPVASAELLYRSAPDFYNEPSKARSLLSNRFRELLVRDKKCADGMICALDSDPWMDAQDGDIVNPTFKELSRSGTSARVEMCYQFALGAATEQRCAIIVALSDSTGRWLVDDLVGPSGTSLHHTLESYDYDG